MMSPHQARAQDLILMKSVSYLFLGTKGSKPLSTYLWAMRFPTVVFIMMTHVLERPNILRSGVKTTSSIFPLCFLSVSNLGAQCVP